VVMKERTSMSALGQKQTSELSRLLIVAAVA